MFGQASFVTRPDVNEAPKCTEHREGGKVVEGGREGGEGGAR